MISKTYKILNICCAQCTATIEHELAPIEGVEKVDASFEPQQVTVEVNDKDVFTKVETTLKDIGFPASSSRL